MKNNSRLEQAKQKLAQAFSDLENSITNKIVEIKSHASGENIDDNNDEAINDLAAQINTLQTSLEELSEENQDLSTKNQQLIEELNNIKTQGREIYNQITVNLDKIKKIIGNISTPL